MVNIFQRFAEEKERFQIEPHVVDWRLDHIERESNIPSLLATHNYFSLHPRVNVYCSTISVLLQGPMQLAAIQ
jgi:hypothetical protein